MTNVIFTTSGDGYWSRAIKNVRITDMRVSYVNEDKDFGELCVYFNTADWNVNTDGLIYTDSAFLECVQTALIAAGISIEAAEDVCYSEQGMQDEGRVSCDAYALADYVRARMQNTVQA